jgi:mono/diheme cytochrome c family protein
MTCIKFTTTALATAALAIAIAGCGKGAAGDGSSTVKITAADRTAAHEIFNTRCAVCHGQFGRGDGTGAAALAVKPRNYSDAAWQKSVTDADIERTIVLGGAGVGKSALMAPNPDLADKPGVVAALREKVRSFVE